MQYDRKTAVFVMTHKKYEEQPDPVYHTLQVGRASGERTLPYTGDDTGDNISEQNFLYGELTGMYWIWKNVSAYENIGICHYRRFFLEDGAIMSGESYDRILTEYRLILPRPNISAQTNREGYAESHNIKDLLYVQEAVERLTPAYADAFYAMLEAKTSYYANLSVMRHEDYDAYCAWMFAVLAEAGKKIDVSTYDNYHKRVYGFLSELLLNTWVLFHQDWKRYETPVGVTGEKAETTELKTALASFVKKGDYSGGRKYYYDFMKRRPDVRLAQSDLTGEIPLMEIILYILEQEKAAGQKGFASVSDELSALLVHYRRVVEILRSLGDGTADETMVQYILDHQLSAVAAEIILRNTDGIRAEHVRKILGIG